MTEEKKESIRNIIIAIVAVLIAIGIVVGVTLAGYGPFAKKEPADTTEQEYTSTVITADTSAAETDAATAAVTTAVAGSTSQDVTSKTDDTTGKPSDTTKQETTTGNPSETTKAATSALTTQKNNTTTTPAVTSEVSDVTPDVTTKAPEPEDPTTGKPETQSPEVTTYPGTTSPELTTSPEVSVEVTTEPQSPETTTGEMMTYTLPAMTTNVDIPDVLIAPNGDQVPGTWKNLHGDIYFDVDLTGRIGDNVGDTCRWWCWNESYNTLEFGKYTRRSEDWIAFKADEPLPPVTHGEPTVYTEITTIPPGTWW